MANRQTVRTCDLFKLTSDGKAAIRVAVKIGRLAQDKAEIIEGLEEGDRIILSDMSAYQEFDRVQLQ